jgi:hypothetical protein
VTKVVTNLAKKAKTAPMMPPSNGKDRLYVILGLCPTKSTQLIIRRGRGTGREKKKGELEGGDSEGRYYMRGGSERGRGRVRGEGREEGR